MTTPINQLPVPPSPADSPVDFNTKAFALLGALPAFVTEANAQASGLDAAVVAAETEADAAALKAGEALTSANNAAISKTGADSARDDAALSAAAALASKNAAQAIATTFGDVQGAVDAAAAQANLATTNGQTQVTLATEQVTLAAAQAVIATDKAGVASAQAGISSTKAAEAQTAKTESEAARDAALIQAGVYVDEPTGRAAVGDGQAFKVQGSGSVAAYEYRRVNASTVSTLIATYPSKAAYDGVAERQKIKADLVVGKNLFNPNDADVVFGYYVDANLGSLAANGAYNATGFIPVVAGVTYTFSHKRQIAWFNSSKAYLSGDLSGVGNAVSLVAPAGAAYVRCSVSTGFWSAYQVEVGSSKTGYVPYTLTIPPAQLRDGGVSELKMALSAIGYRHTKFLQAGKNLFNPADPDVALGYFVDALTGNMTASASYNTTGFIPVTGGASYRLSYGNQIAWYDASKVYISGVTGIGGGATTQVAPANAVYLRVMVNLAAWATFQVEAGTTSTGYEAFKLVLSGPGGADIQATPKDASVTPQKTTFFSVGKNKFNVADPAVAIGSYVLYDSGALLANASYNATGYIPVVAGTTYTLSFKHQIAWYDANKVYLSGSSSTDTNKAQTAPAGAAFLRCSVAVAYWSTFQVEVGTTQTLYESYGYEIKDQGGFPIRTQAATQETDFLTVAAKQYVPYGKEVAVYHENIAKDYPKYRGKTGVSITGGKETGPSTKLTPTSGQVNATIAGTATVADDSFNTLSTKSFSIVVTDPTKTTAVNIQNIGDSYTGRMTWVNVINATAAAAGLTFSGNRTSSAATPAVRCEGQGGWLLSSYFTVDYMGFLSPFMQPVTAGYLYYGQTSFWVDANSATPSYNANNFVGTKDLFSPTTGRKLAPNVGDVMGEGGGYIQWDGSAWVSIASATFGGFAFSYAKYRQAWNIPAPTILHVLLGTNDFMSATEGNFGERYAGFKANYNSLIASVKADTPGVKIIVGIPVSSGRQGKWGTLDTEKRKRAYYLLAKSLNADYGGREAENIYVLDYHSIVDRFYGYDQTAEKPFADYSGTAGDDLYKSDTIHLGADGFKQMGNAYMGLIQYLR